MKRRITKTELIDYINHLDKRTEDLTTDEMDLIMTNGFAELNTVVNPFTNEEVIDISNYVEAGETSITFDVEEDVIDVYDLYMDVVPQTGELIHGINLWRNSEVLYKDGRYVGRVHLDLDSIQFDNKWNVSPTDINNVVIKYFYTPAVDFTDAFIDSQSYLALQFALATSLHDYLKDVETASQKRAGMMRTGSKVMHSKPEDFHPEYQKPSMFPTGV